MNAIIRLTKTRSQFAIHLIIYHHTHLTSYLAFLLPCSVYIRWNIKYPDLWLWLALFLLIREARFVWWIEFMQVFSIMRHNISFHKPIWSTSHSYYYVRFSNPIGFKGHLRMGNLWMGQFWIKIFFFIIIFEKRFFVFELRIAHKNIFQYQD